MQSLFTNRCILSSLAAGVVIMLYGCAGMKDSKSSQAGENIWRVPARTANPVNGSEPASTVIDARPAALINGMAVTWGELRPYLNELAGGQALKEVVLDRRINQALNQAGIVIGLDDAVAERKRMLESFNDDPNEAIKQLNQWRKRECWGDSRFEALLMRKAGLRALVQKKNSKTLDPAADVSTSDNHDQEQALMDQLADQLLSQTTVSIFDDELKESWKWLKQD